MISFFSISVILKAKNIVREGGNHYNIIILFWKMISCLYLRRKGRYMKTYQTEQSSSRIWEAPVITYVVCSSRVRAIKHELLEGINPYRVKLIRLQDKNADEFFARMAAKKNLSKEDFVEMLLTPLMSGEMRQSVRIVNSIEYLKRQQDKMNESEVLRLQSMLYALANKFLSKQELENVKEVLNMTILGEMLVEEGREEGREEGIRALIRACTNLSVSRCEIISSLIREFSMTQEKAECYLEKYWTPAE